MKKLKLLKLSPSPGFAIVLVVMLAVAAVIVVKTPVEGVVAPIGVLLTVPPLTVRLSATRASLMFVVPAFTPLIRRSPIPAFAALICVLPVRPVTSPASVIALIDPST